MKREMERVIIETWVMERENGQMNRYRMGRWRCTNGETERKKMERGRQMNGEM